MCQAPAYMRAASFEWAQGGGEERAGRQARQSLICLDQGRREARTSVNK